MALRLPVCIALIISVWSTTSSYGQSTRQMLNEDSINILIHDSEFNLEVHRGSLRMEIEETFREYLLRINLPAFAALYIDDKLIYYTNEQATIQYDLDTYESTNYPIKLQIIPAVHDAQVNAYLISKKNNPDSGFSEREMERQIRYPFRDFIIAGSIICLLAWSVIAFFFRRITRELYSIPRFFTISDSDPLELISRKSQTAQWLFLTIHSFVMCLCLLIYYDNITIRHNLLGIAIDQNPWPYWIIGGLLILLFWFVKYLLILIFSSLFAIGRISLMHFYDYTRFSILFFTAFGILFFALYIISSYTLIIPFYWLIIALSVFFGVRFIFLFMKLLRVTRFSFVHLFLYLCATELALGFLVIRAIV